MLEEAVAEVTRKGRTVQIAPTATGFDVSIISEHVCLGDEVDDPERLAFAVANVDRALDLRIARDLGAPAD